MTQPKPPVQFRDAEEADAPALAALHAQSWRTNYRGSLSDDYLDGPVEAERRRVWEARLGFPQAGQIVILAEQAGVLIGFACSFTEHDPSWGTLIDNLHVATPHKREGVGRSLMRQMAGRLVQAVPGRPVYLFVLEANRAARGFYDRIGGEPVEHTRTIEPDGSECAVIRYAWSSPARLLEAAARPRVQGFPGPDPA